MKKGTNISFDLSLDTAMFLPDAESSLIENWCYNIRYTYNAMRKNRQTGLDFSVDRIEDLERIGFQWQALTNHGKKRCRKFVSFEQRCRELTLFKEEFGHCNVPVQYVDNPGMGKWVSNLREAYKRIQ